MFYEPKKGDHGLPHTPFKALVAPRPIGWVSTLSANGVANIAPYSFFNAVSAMPDMVMFSSYGWKDSIENISQNGEFVCNYVNEDMTEAMNITSIDAPSDISEFDTAKIKTANSRLVAPPRVEGTPAALECRKTEIIELKDASGNATDHFMVITGNASSLLDMKLNRHIA